VSSSTMISSKSAPIHLYFTKTNLTKKELMSEIELLNTKVEHLQEELENLKNLSTMNHNCLEEKNKNYALLPASQERKLLATVKRIGRMLNWADFDEIIVEDETAANVSND
ncbi:7741_t:CDS:2, partial [Racocetra persica]